MKKLSSILPRWFPAFVMMLAIFFFSSQPGGNLPDFYNWDYFIKKASHMVGYGLLALAFYYFFEFDPNRIGFAWALAVLYAATDEFHQSFVPGRGPSVFDVLFFDNLGSITALWLYEKFGNKKWS